MRPRRRFSAEEAHRTPRGKRSILEWKSTANLTKLSSKDFFSGLVKTQWVFILANLIFFVGGTILTLVHNLFDFPFIDMAWKSLTSIPAVIILLYLFFWALLGYEIGKGFGHKGRRLMKKTFILSILPNIILMNLTLFKLIPHDWFQPLLSPAFIFICILFTALLYPICWVGYRWGKKASI